MKNNYIYSITTIDGKTLTLTFIQEYALFNQIFIECCYNHSKTGLEFYHINTNHIVSFELA